jgi:hypothetical protein
MQSYNDDKKNDEKKKFNDHHSLYKDRPRSTDDIDRSMSLQLHISTTKSASFTFDIDSTAIIVPIIVSIIVSTIVSIIVSAIVSIIVPTIVSTIVPIIVSIIVPIIVSINVPQSTTPHSLQQSVRQSVRQSNKYQLVSRDSGPESSHALSTRGSGSGSPHKSASSESSSSVELYDMTHGFDIGAVIKITLDEIFLSV